MEWGGFKVNDIREIVTKAVIGKGKRRFEMPIRMPQISGTIGRVLGAFITNHRMDAKKSGDMIEVSGQYDIHVWFTHQDDVESEIIRLTVDYGDIIELTDALRNHILETDEITVEEVISPYTTDVLLDGGIIIVEMAFEVGVEVIGETKMRVAILGPVVERPQPALTFEPEEDDLSEIDDAITPDFLEAIIEPFE